MYFNISIQLFVSGYMQVIEAGQASIRPFMANHVIDLMGDAELSGWEPVHAFHAVWLQQL